MRKMKWKVAGWIMALIGAASLAHAEQENPCKKCNPCEGGQRPSREQMMQRFDVDGDGQLSRAEKETLRRERAKRNKGTQGGQRPSREKVIQRFDTDGDGQLNETERVALRKEFKQRRREHKRQNKPVE